MHQLPQGVIDAELNAELEAILEPSSGDTIPDEGEPELSLPAVESHPSRRQGILKRVGGMITRIANSPTAPHSGTATWTSPSESDNSDKSQR